MTDDKEVKITLLDGWVVNTIATVGEKVLKEYEKK